MKRYRYIESRMNNTDLDGYYRLVEFDNHGLSIDSWSEYALREDAAELADMSDGEMSYDEALEYVMDRVVEIDPAEGSPRYFAQVAAEDEDRADEAGLPDSVCLYSQSRVEAVEEFAAAVAPCPVVQIGNGLEVAVMSVDGSEIVYLLDEE